jgi:wyosine [tRNA(Phe)-imidazoG37] synthetase (radical SAM superfamily)
MRCRTQSPTDQCVGYSLDSMSLANSRFVYGPVASRRLGQSLGIDPIPLKVCNWNCVYCQLGRTRPVTNERKIYHPPAEILGELREVLERLSPDDMDWITVVGSGEPTLNAGLGSLLQGIKDLSQKPIAVITNGSLLYLPEVRQDLLLADAVLPSLDAGSAELYKKINRAHPDITFERLVSGLATFRKEYEGKLWAEVMLLKGLNDTEEALSDLARVLEDVRPDEVHLNTPDRPPAEPWVEPTDAEGMMRARALLGDVARVVPPVELKLELEPGQSALDALLAIIGRHPMQEDELDTFLRGWDPVAGPKVLDELQESKEARLVERYGTRFWVSTRSFFPERSRRPGPGLERGCLGDRGN